MEIGRAVGDDCLSVSADGLDASHALLPVRKSPLDLLTFSFKHGQDVVLSRRDRGDSGRLGLPEQS